MKPLPRSSVSLWTLLVLSALLKISRPQCDECNETTILTTTTTTVELGSTPNCTISTGDGTSGNGSISGLNPGTVHEIFLNCFNCCRNATTKPEAVKNVSVAETTTSSVSLNWTEPAGKRSFFRVQWNGGEKTVNTTETSITNLTAGVKYTITIVAVAGDGHTEGEKFTFCQYTRPGEITEKTVTTNTSSISLNWTPPPGEVFKYRVEWHSGGAPMSRFVNNTSAVLSDLIPGTTYTITITAIAGDNEAGKPYTFPAVTKPAVIKNLLAFDVTTLSVYLNWTEPEGNSSGYRVQWTDGNVPVITDVNETHLNITNLTAGVEYEITVTAVAGDDRIEGQNISVSQYTKPEKPVDIEMTAQGTDNLRISWNLPKGKVDHYVVNISNVELMYMYSNITTATTAHFTNLRPGRIFVITVTAVAGNFSDTSAQNSTATVPTPPDSIIISQRTNSSLHLQWPTPALMEGAPHISYKITYQPEVGEVQNTSATVNNTELSLLSSGTSYNITVQTVGPKNLKSTVIHNSAFTLPNPVLNLVASPKSTTSVEVNWLYPQGAKQYYKYLVQAYNTTGVLFNKTVINNSTDVPDLEPGTKYNISVTTIAAPGSASTEEQTVSYTMPKAVTNLSVVDVNTTAIRLTWQRQSDHKPSYSYLVKALQDGMVVKNDSTETETYTFFHLYPGKLFTFDVFTVVEGVKSTVESTSSYTMPNPVLNLVASPKSTTSVEVTWLYPQGAKQYYKYLVQAYDTTGVLFNKTVSNNSTDVPDLEPGTKYNISVTTIAAPGSASTEEQTVSYTMPKAVTNLSVVDVNTTAIRLTWQRQSDHKPSYSYLVKALQDGMVVKNDSTETETYTFFHLYPGKLFTFDMFTVVEGVKSTVESTSSYTKPETVSDILAIGSTTDMSVSWSPAGGQVLSYTVLLHGDSQLVDSKTDLSNTTTNITFVGLNPGVLYCVVVVTKIGPFERNSPSVCNATLPNPPGPIMVASQTVESIKFTWPFPEDMNHSQYNFSVSSLNGPLLIQNNWFLLDGLQSGSPYNVSVVTVGVQSYESTAVTAINYTRPYNVTTLEQAEITTNAVTLVWEQLDSKSDYSYAVQASIANGSLVALRTTSNRTKTISGLLSGSYYSFTVTTKTADGTQAAPVKVSYFTRPYNIRQLVAETINTTAVHLTWMKPLEYKDEYTYEVKTTGCGYQSKNLTGEVAQISGLTPGTECTFCVFVRAGDGIKGKENCTSQYTKPEAVQPRVSSQGSNSSILVSWTKPPGRVESYKVDLNRTPSVLELDCTNTSCLFENLSAGRLYTAVVTTCSGPFNASSEFITNATFPNPPGPIEILTKTTHSIDIRWKEAPLMTSASFHYQLTDISRQGGEYISATSTSHTFNSLLSGTSYNISVATVGVMGFESEKVQIHMVTTRPFSVQSLEAPKTQEKNITVTWGKPNEYKKSYRYNLTWQSPDGSIHNSTITEETQYDISDLVPGSRYNFSVTTETSDGTQSAPTRTTNCTNASPVINLQCKGPNKTAAELILSWTKPKGQYISFLVTVKKDNKIINSASNILSLNHIVSNLSHYTDYNLTVETESCGQPSNPVSRHCQTGITSPPIPADYESLLVVKERIYNKFSLQIDYDLLNSRNGPITHVGVLMTNSLTVPPGDTSNFTKYLGNTYDQWKKKDTPVYLATVTENIFQSRSGETHLNIEVGDESKWEDYTNGALDANGKYQYAIVLFTSLTLQGSLVNVKGSLVSITGFSTVELPQNPVYIGIAIGATLGIFCILVIILIGFIIYWKRLSKKESPDIQIHSMRAKVSVAVRVEDYEAYYRKQKADSNCGFAEEFEDLKLVGTGQSKTNALTLENKPKNRYNNVLPYDPSRVKLSIHGSPYDDYINANYMPGYNSRKEFIAAQGPLPTTVNEFWRMIWEKNVQTLVMLTRCNEQGRVKCEQYWNSGTKHFENITVTTTSEIPLDDWTIRDFDIKNMKTAETRSVRHFHFTAWPDHGVPQTTELLISFRHLVREHMDQYSRHSPTVVHCSAGVGRTGTFIAIDRLIFQIERENIVDVYGIVHDLRMHRPLMVQTEDQYVFLNQCALDIIRSRTGTNVDLIYQNAAALSIYENVEPKKGFPKNGYHNA